MSADSTGKFKALIKDFDNAMFVTQTPTDELRARPMVIAEHMENGDLLFITSGEAPKTKEALEHPQVNVTMQSSNKFLSLSGIASISFDRAKIDEVWNPSWKAWFPKGKDDPNISLIRVTAHSGEYWDMSGASKIRFVFEKGKAIVQGEKLDDYPESMHGKVDLK
jgi:general stress protein 26